jgi:hypothetical protein
METDIVTYHSTANQQELLFPFVPEHYPAMPAYFDSYRASCLKAFLVSQLLMELSICSEHVVFSIDRHHNSYRYLAFLQLHHKCRMHPDTSEDLPLLPVSLSLLARVGDYVGLRT